MGAGAELCPGAEVVRVRGGIQMRVACAGSGGGRLALGGEGAGGVRSGHGEGNGAEGGVLRRGQGCE